MRSIFIGLMTIFLLLAVLLTGYSIVYAQKILPRTYIAGDDVGSLSRQAAAKKIEQKVSLIKTIKFSSDQKSWEIKLSDLGIILRGQETVDAAYNRGKSGGFGQNIQSQLASLFFKKKLPLDFALDEEKFIQSIDEQIAKDIEDKQLETQLVVTNAVPKIIVGQKGKRIDRSDLLAQIKAALANPASTIEIKVLLKHSEPLVTAENAELAKVEAQKIVARQLKLKTQDKEFIADVNLISTWILGQAVENKQSSNEKRTYLLSADINQKKVESYVQAIAEEVNKDPTNARISMEGGQLKILQTSSPGLVLKQTETVEAITKVLLERKTGSQQEEVALIVEEKQPEISTESVNNLGIKELIGKAATDFFTSPENRKHNIKTGANALSGIIIKNGDEFSALKFLGKVDASQGYLPELVIKDNKLENQYGGGLCQNATTLFRAIMDAALPVTNRQNHSRRVSYYEKAIATAGVNLTFDKSYANIGSALVGYDATVFVPQPDLKFKNNTGNAVLVQEYTSGNTLFAEIYGTKDSRKASISKAEVLSTKPTPETIYHNALDLPKGTNKQVVKGVPGAKTKFTYTITYSDGKQESQDFASYYRPVAPEIQVGSQEVAPPVPTQ